METTNFSTITLILEEEMDLLEEEASEVAIEDVVAVILVEAQFNVRYATRLVMMQVSATSGCLFHLILKVMDLTMEPMGIMELREALVHHLMCGCKALYALLPLDLLPGPPAHHNLETLGHKLLKPF